MRMGASCAGTLAAISLVTFVSAGPQEPSRLTRLADDPAQDGFPSWSLAGRPILFSRYGGDETPEKAGQWLVSPDGTKIAFVSRRSGHFDIWTVDVDALQLRRELLKPGRWKVGEAGITDSGRRRGVVGAMIGES